MNPYYQQCMPILLQCKVDSGDTEILVTARDRGGLWKVNEFVGIS